MDHLEADTSTKSSASGFVCDVNTEKHIGAGAACFFDNTCHKHCLPFCSPTSELGKKMWIHVALSENGLPLIDPELQC